MHGFREQFAHTDGAGIPPEAPRSWKARLNDYRWTLQTIGCSEAAVFRLEAEDRPALFAKTEPVGPFSELAGEMARLKWLREKGILCPTVLSEEREDGRDWCLMTAIPGRDLASSPNMNAEEIVATAAAALRALHRLDVAECPFDQTLDRRIELARQRMEAGLVDEEDFDAERLGTTARQLFEEVLELRPSREQLTVVHGDACLPNLLAENDGFSGFIDCGRLGIADLHQDLALASWSISHNLGKQWVEPFFSQYEVESDPERLAFYRLLDEFF